MHINLNTEPRISFLQQIIRAALSFFRSPENRDALIHPIAREGVPPSPADSTPVQFTMEANPDPSSNSPVDSEDIMCDGETEDEPSGSSDSSELQDEDGCKVVRCGSRSCRPMLDDD